MKTQKRFSQRILILLLFVSTSLLAQNIGIKTVSPQANLDINGSVAIREGSALVLSNGQNNNVAISDMGFFRISGPTAVFSITGFDNGFDGRLLTILNSTNYTMTIRNNTGSNASNRLNTGSGDIDLYANGVVTFVYNANLSKWLIAGGQGLSHALYNAWSLLGNDNTDEDVDFVGTTDTASFAFKTNNIERARISSGGYIGIGTNNPQSFLHLMSNSAGASNNFIVSSYDDNDEAFFNFERSRGTAASPSNLVNGDDLGGIHFYGYTGGTFSNLSRINAKYVGNGSTSLSNLDFSVSNTDQMRLDENGNLGIGTTSPTSRLAVNGSVARAITTTTTNLTLNATHHTVIITGGTPTITLPNANTCDFRIYVIVNQTGSARTISSYRDYSATVTTVAANSGIKIQSDGNDWYKIE